MTDAATRLAEALTDRYRIERELGQGGMATVYLAHDVRHDRKVALKVLRPELSAILGGERFLAEIKTTANLQHPHILSLFDSGEAAGLVYYVMPFVEGESLRDRLNREKQLPVEDAVRIAREVADALEYAHQHGIVHRDIKPENILLHGGHAMVADFGIALAASRSDGGSRMTETGMSLGTPHYMAPEQAMGEREITPKADIYALGCVLYEMLTAEPPFVGATAQAIIARVMTEEPRSLTLQRRSIPPHVEAACRAALEKLPADRFASAAQFADALGRSDYALPATRMRTAAAAPRSRRALVLSSVPWVLALLGGGLLGWSRYRPKPAEPPIRLSIIVPESTAIRTEGPGNSIALSPDGSTLVYTGDSPGRRRMLYVRSMDLLAPRVLPGTDDASEPFFSPDGAWVAFFSSGQLKRVALAGGPPLTVAAAPTPRGGTWAADGSIIFAGVSSGPLMRVAAAGGPVDTLTRLNADSSETSHRMPHVLPDGRSVVFTVQRRGKFSAALLSLTDRRVTMLMNDALDARYEPTGHVAYGTDDGALVAVPFNPRRGAVTGSPVSLMEGMLVKTALGAADFAVSDNGRMAYVAGEDLPLQLLLVDRAGVQQTVATGYTIASPRFSPDGRRIAFSSIEDHASDIRVADLDHPGTLTRLTFGNTAPQYPEWSADGRRVAFSSVNPGSPGNGLDLFWTSADGSGQPEPLLTIPGAQQEILLPRSGRQFVFRTVGTTTSRDIMIGSLDSATAARPWLQTPFDERSMALSPDGRWLAYVSNASGHDEVYVREFPTPQGQWQISSGGGIEPRWAPDGRGIYYRAGDTLVTVAITTSPSFRVGERHVVFVHSFRTGDTHHAHWDVAPDGRHFVFISQPRLMPGVVVTLNWFDEVRRRSGVAGR